VTQFLLIKGRPGTGLGDHIITLVSGLLYASRHGLTACVDWRDGSLAPKGCNAFPELFQVEGLAMCDAVPETEDVQPVVWRDRLGALTGELYDENGGGVWDRAAFARRYSVQVLAAPTAEVSVHVLCDHLRELAREMFPGGDVDDSLRAFIRDHIRTAPGVEEEASKVLSGSKAGVTGLHVRMTDKSPARAEDYSRCLRGLGAEARAQPIFLATDSSRAESEIRRLLPKARLITREKWMPQGLTPIHLSADNPDLLQTTRDALVEMRTLSLCSPLVVHPASSFGLCAGFFCQGQVVDVSTRSHRPLASRVAARLWRMARRGFDPLLTGAQKST